MTSDQRERDIQKMAGLDLLVEEQKHSSRGNLQICGFCTNSSGQLADPFVAVRTSFNTI
jgi:hypothetical protein